MTGEAYIAGVGVTPFTAGAAVTLESLGQAAVRAALMDAGIIRAEVEEIFCASSLSGAAVGQRVVRGLGLTGRPVVNIENGGAGGATAVREAATAIRAGRCDIALVIGIDLAAQAAALQNRETPADLDAAMGLDTAEREAMRARRYMLATGARMRDLAEVAAKARAVGALNPLALFREAMAATDVLAAPSVASPLTRPMLCSLADGAAAVVLISEKRARKSGGNPVRVAAAALQSGAYTHGARDLSRCTLSGRTACLAYETAGLRPRDIDVAEIDDASVASELVHCEALGFCHSGGAPALLASGRTRTDGDICINPSGGMLGRGQAPGATGIAQLAEIVIQLKRQAGDRQSGHPRIGLTHSLGGMARGLDRAACAVLILAI